MLVSAGTLNSSRQSFVALTEGRRLTRALRHICVNFMCGLTAVARGNKGVMTQITQSFQLVSSWFLEPAQETLAK